MSNSVIDNQEQLKLIDFDVVNVYVDLMDADDHMLHDFVFWMHVQDRDSLGQLWRNFQRSLRS